MKQEQPALCTSLSEIFTYYPDSDKQTLHSYIEVYSELFAPYRETATAILEIGVRYGGSLRAWRDYFQIAQIFGVDSGEEDELWTPVNSKRIHVLGGDSTSINIREKLEDYGPFQIVIDDGSHKIQDQFKTFKNLMPLLDKNWLYIIEDLETIENAEMLQSAIGGRVIDRRHIKNRHDDILWVFTMNDMKPANLKRYEGA